MGSSRILVVLAGFVVTSLQGCGSDEGICTPENGCSECCTGPGFPKNANCVGDDKCGAENEPMAEGVMCSSNSEINKNVCVACKDPDCKTGPSR